MLTTNRPNMMPVPFADTGARQTIPVESQIGVTGGRASYTDGFPPLTRTPLAAGGIPPFGTDMNGILHAVTEAIRWQQTGAGFPFNSEFAAATNGYPLGAVVASSDGLGSWVNTVEGNLSDPETIDGSTAGWEPEAHVGVSTQVLAGSSVTMPALAAAKSRLILTGTLTANVNLRVPAWLNKSWDVTNNCLGNYSVTIKTPDGTGVAIQAGGRASVYCDGTNVAYKNLLAANAFSEIGDLGLVQQALQNLRLGAGAIPIGMPFFWPSAAMPNTVMEEWADHVFLKWNDATFSATQFPKLAKVIPSLRLNDARGDFPRICDDGRGVDSGRVLLSSQSATGIRTAAMDYFGYDETTSGGTVGTAYVSSDSIAYAQPPGAMSPNGLKTLIPIMTDNCITAQQIPAGLSNPYGAWITMRPRNIAFNFLVRAK